MSQASDLPLYIACYDLLHRTTVVVGHLPRDLKYGLGQSMLEKVWAMLDGVMAAHAGNLADKQRILPEVLLTFEQFKIRVRLARELRGITDKQYAWFVEQQQEIGNMLHGWLRWAERQSTVEVRGGGVVFRYRGDEYEYKLFGTSLRAKRGNPGWIITYPVAFL